MRAHALLYRARAGRRAPAVRTAAVRAGAYLPHQGRGAEKVHHRDVRQRADLIRNMPDEGLRHR